MSAVAQQETESSPIIHPTIDACDMESSSFDGMAAAWMLARREWVRFFRQRNRVTAAILQPLLFWLLFGTGLRGSFVAEGELDFLQFFLPGTVALIVLFTAIFATISVIEDRREGFMQSVLVAPVGRWPVLVGKVMGGAAIAWVQAAIFLAMVYLFGTVAISATVFPLMLLLLIMAIAMCSLGMIVAWPMESTQGFHAIMMLGLMPMWLLAGTFFPIPNIGPDASIGQIVLGGIMRANPLSYTVIELRRLMYPSVDFASADFASADFASADFASAGFASAGFAPSSIACWLVTMVFAIVTTLIAWRLMRGSRKVDVIV